MSRMPDGQSDDGSTQTEGSAGLLAAAIVGGDIAEQRALGDVKQKLFGRTPEPIRIGRYTLLEKLGSGGLGVVYLALDPELDRRVAIKLMRSGSQSPRHLARFIREAQAMARISHPNVVEVFDVGGYDVPPEWPLAREAPSSGVFIAMAHIDGGSLREWAAAKPRSWRKLLEVLIGAGRGLAAAHAAGMCHRDFKPANVLVGSDERPRVVDFGLARLVEHGSDAEPTEGGDQRTYDAAITATGSIVGTPAYMAPEQHRGAEVGAAADQFAFCVTAFEALYGQRPFPQKSAAALAVAKQEGAVALVRGTTGVPAAVQRVLVRGLAHDPGDRYASMDDLLAALDRAARGPLPHWAAAAIPVLGLGAVGALLIMHPNTHAKSCDAAAARWSAAWGPDDVRRVEESFDATGARFAARSFARVSAELDGYGRAWLVTHEAACATAGSDDGRSDRGLSCLAHRLAQVEALVGALAEADAGLVQRSAGLVGNLPAPAECLRAQTDAQLLRSESPDLLAGVLAAREQLAVASTLRHAGRIADARNKATAVLVDAAGLEFDPLEAEALFELGACEAELGQADSAERLLGDAYYIAERIGYARLSADAATRLVSVLAESPKRFDEAMRWAEHARAALERSGDDPAQRGRLLSVTGAVRYRAGRFDAAIADARAAKEIYEELGDENALAAALANFGGFLAIAGHGDEAEPHLRRSLELREELLGADHPDVAQSLNGIATILSARGDHGGALALQRRALAIWEDNLGENHPNVAMALSNVATSQMRKGDFRAAEATGRRALALREANLDEDHVDVGFSRIALAEVLLHRGQLDEALALAQRGLTGFVSTIGEDHQYVAFASIVAGQVEEQRGALDRARAHFERAIAIVGTRSDDPLYGEAHAGLSRVQDALARAAADLDQR